MKLIIDGYNILRYAGGSADESHKKGFAMAIARYVHAKKHTAIVVYDGGPSPRPIREKQGNVVIVYAGYNQSADDYIKQLLDQEQGKDVLLASSDNELCRYAVQRDIPSIEAGAFKQLIYAKEKKSGSDDTTNLLERYAHASSNEELAAIMEETTRRMPHKQEEEETEKRAPRSQTLSKEEKKILSKLKKL